MAVSTNHDLGGCVILLRLYLIDIGMKNYAGFQGYSPFHYFPTKICHFLNVSKWLGNLITPSYCLHFSKYKLGTLGVKYTVFMQNAL